MNAVTTIAAPAISATTGRARFTGAEFLHMLERDAFQDIKVELIEGELERMPPPGNAHSLLQVMIVARLVAVMSEPRVRAEFGIDLGNDTIVGGDAGVLRHPVESDGMIPAEAVALVVEIAVSTRDRDLGLKRRLYAAADIPTYWVVDAERRSVHVFDRPEGGDYVGLALVRFGEPLAVPGTDAAIVLE